MSPWCFKRQTGAGGWSAFTSRLTKETLMSHKPSTMQIHEDFVSARSEMVFLLKPCTQKVSLRINSLVNNFSSPSMLANNFQWIRYEPHMAQSFLFAVFKKQIEQGSRAYCQVTYFIYILQTQGLLNSSKTHSRHD